MGLGSIGAAIGGAIASGVASSVANKNKGNKGSSSSGSSGSKGSSSSGTGGRYSYTDSDGDTRYSSENTDWAAAWQEAYNRGDVAGMQTALQGREDKLDGKYDSWQGWASSATDRYVKNQSRPSDEIADEYTQQTNDYMQQYQQMIDALRAEQQAKVDTNVADLNAQRPKVQQAGAQANAAAQQNYYQLINPNGASAEQRAALGLSSSGLTESSQIAAGNAYMGAVNANEQTVNQQLAQIDLAITQAQLSGDLATAQQLQSYYNTALQQGMQQANNIASLGQWGLENAQNQTQLGVQNALGVAGLTGYYNGQPTMAGQQNAVTIEGQQINNQMQQLMYMIQQKYGMSQAEAELALMQAQLSGLNLDNVMKQMQNDYAKKNM